MTGRDDAASSDAGWAGADWAGPDWANPDWADPDWDGADWDGAEFDPDTSPPDGEEAWLNDLPAELREEYLVDPRSGAAESMAAGFVHHAGGRPGIGFAAGGVADKLEPGPVLAGLVDAAAGALGGAARGLGSEAPGGAAAPDGTTGLDIAVRELRGLGESELIGVLCASRRMASWAAAMEAASVITLARRRAAQARECETPGLIEHVHDELAAALTLTGRAGSRLLEISGGLARLPRTWAALAAGVIDWPRAIIFADELAALGDRDARAAEAAVLPGAGQLTTGQLRAALRRAVLAADPAAAGRRRRAARKDAGVYLWDEPSGNSGLAGRELPPAEMIAADQRITVLARWLRQHGAEGTFQQLRAAVFTALLAGRPVTTLIPADSQSAGSGSAGSGSAAAGSDSGSACPGPTADGSADASPDGAAPGGADPADSPGWPAMTGTVNLTMPLSAWLGITEAPGEVAGSGPADADTCRDLASWLSERPPGAGQPVRWCLTLTDRVGQAVAHACARHGPGPPGPVGMRPAAKWLAGLRPVRLAVGECAHERQVPGYQPPRSLRHLVAIRQQTCGFPGCRRPAAACDQDHTIPYHRGGRTCECNLAPLCRRHHRSKQAAGWQLRQAEPGVLTWTLPHARTYTTRPDPYPA